MHSYFFIVMAWSIIGLIIFPHLVFIPEAKQDVAFHHLVLFALATILCGPAIWASFLNHILEYRKRSRSH